MRVLGVNAYHGDVAAALVEDGRVVAAVEEERFTRVKHTAGVPLSAARACLEIAGIDAAGLDRVAVARAASAHLWRKALFALTHRPGRALAAQTRRTGARRAALPRMLAEGLGIDPAALGARTRFVEHHPAHLASAFFVSPFEEAAVCAIDGFGDFVSTSWGVGRGTSLDVRRRVFFPHSLGILYLALTQYLGFLRYGDEFKVMGLAPYGSPDVTATLRRLVTLREDGSFRLDLAYFRHWTGEVTMEWPEGAPTVPVVYTPALEALLGPARRPDEPITPRHEAIAASLQQVFEEAYLHVLRAVRRQTGQRRLCLAGGCAMNSVANGRVRRDAGFDEVFIQPAASDNGTALGAALAVLHGEGGVRTRARMPHACLGPAFTGAEVEAALRVHAADVEASSTACTFEDDDALCAWTAERLAAGEIVGWYQGRMEWGARALGNRSILADPRRADMREIINTKIKCRERFRPFAPSVLEEALDAYFLDAAPDPFMQQVYPVRPEQRGVIPAVTHVDGSGRLQTVSDATNPLYARLIRAFAARTGVPVLLNTSFNENEPIVMRPAEALDCFLRTRMDVLALGRRVLRKRDASGGAAP